MKRQIALFFTLLYLLTTTQLSEVFKLPLFVSHYLDFKGNLVEYVVHHYGGHEKDADWEVDMKLPFMDLSSPLVMVFDLPVPTVIYPPKPLIFVSQQPIVTGENLHLNHVPDSPYHPPRLV